MKQTPGSQVFCIFYPTTRPLIAKGKKTIPASLDLPYHGGWRKLLQSAKFMGDFARKTPLFRAWMESAALEAATAFPRRQAVIVAILFPLGWSDDAPNVFKSLLSRRRAVCDRLPWSPPNRMRFNQPTLEEESTDAT